MVLIKGFLISLLCQIQWFVIFLLGEVILRKRALKVAESTHGRKEDGGCSLGEQPSKGQV